MRQLVAPGEASLPATCECGFDDVADGTITRNVFYWTCPRCGTGHELEFTIDEVMGR